MGLFSKKYEDKERAFIKQVTKRGVLFEDAAKIREKYGREFKETSFIEFKEEINKLME